MAIALLSACGSERDASATPAADTPVAPSAAPRAAPAEANEPPAASMPTPPAPPGAIPATPPVSFDPPVLDFGIVVPSSTARGLITIRNEGEADVRIIASRTSCGCTNTTPLDGRVIPAGQTLTFDASMKIKSGLGPKHEQVAILFEGYAEGLVRYDLRAEASLPVRAVPPVLRATETLTGRVDLESRDGAAFRVLTAGGAPPRFVGFDPATDAPRSHYTIEWDLTAAQVHGEVPWFWVVETDRPDAPIVDLRVQHDTTRVEQPRGRPWVPKDLRVIVGSIEVGTPVEFESYIEFASGIPIPTGTAAVASPSSNIMVELVRTWTVRQELHYRIRMTVTDAPPGPFYELMTLKAAGFDAPLRLIGRVAVELPQR